MQYQEGELRGLALVDARAMDWGSVLTTYGRVTWAALDVYERAASGLPVRGRRPRSYPRQPNGPADRNSPDVDLLRRGSGWAGGVVAIKPLSFARRLAGNQKVHLVAFSSQPQACQHLAFWH